MSLGCNMVAAKMQLSAACWGLVWLQRSFDPMVQWIPACSTAQHAAWKSLRPHVDIVHMDIILLEGVVYAFLRKHCARASAQLQEHCVELQKPQSAQKLHWQRDHQVFAKRSGEDKAKDAQPETRLCGAFLPCKAAQQFGQCRLEIRMCLKCFARMPQNNHFYFPERTSKHIKHP